MPQTDVCADAPLEGYAFAYLDETTKRMIRRGLLKAVAIPGYQVPFASREMPMPCGWGTGGIQVTASILGRDDVLKVIDQGSDDTTNAVSIRDFFRKTTGGATTTHTDEATIIQTPSSRSPSRRPWCIRCRCRSRCAGLSRASRKPAPSTRWRNTGS